MTEDFSKEYKKWVEDLSEEHFNQLILAYTKEYYSTKDVFISNGPYDGGLDLIVNLNGEQIKKSIQISTQKSSFEKKLRSDLESAQLNHTKFSYKNQLDFYYSLSLTPSKKNQLIRIADVEYGINLSIYDSNRFAGLAVDYSSIVDFLYQIKKSAFKGIDEKIDRNSKILFDTLSMSNSSLELKNSFIQSFILSYLFEREADSANNIILYLKEVLDNNAQDHYYQNEIGKLVETGKIEPKVDDEGVKTFSLSEQTKELLEKINTKVKTEELELKASLENILQKYSIEDNLEEVFILLKTLYNESFNYPQDEVETINNGYNRSVNKVFQNIISFLIKEIHCTKEKANNIARELLVICTKNEYLSKSGSSLLLTNLFKSNKLESYLNNSRKQVFLDTPILLQLICREFSNEKIEDALFQAVDMFLDSIERSKISIDLCTTIDYVGEVAGHLREAYELQRFLELDYIKDLGPSKNVFFNFYLNIKDSHNFNKFDDFLEELLGVVEPNFSNNSFFNDVIYKLKEQFEFIDLEVFSPVGYAPDEYSKYKKIYENCLSRSSIKTSSHGNRSFEARRNDLNALLTICDHDYEYEDEHLDPYLITWDTSFYGTRREFEKIDNFSSFQLMPPLKFANCINLIDFKIDTKNINYNIISMVEENFNLSNEKISFIDLLNSFIEKKELPKWKLGRKFANFRKELMHGIDSSEFEKTRNYNLPIDEFLILIRQHYRNPENNYSFQDVVNLFTDNDYSEKIINIIKTNINDFKQGAKIKSVIHKSLDKLIEERKEA